MKIISLILFLLLSHSITACMCQPLTFEEEIERCNFIFSGKVILQNDRFDLVEIKTIWKGDLKDTIRLYHGSSSCYKRRLDLNKIYLIFLENQKSGIYNCSRTTELSFSQDIDKLNKVLMNIRSKKINNLTVNESSFIKNVFINSNLDTLKNLNDKCTFFVFNDSKHDYKVLTIQEFIDYDHFGRIPLLVKLESKNKNMTLFEFAYWTTDLIKPNKSLRKSRKQLKYKSCNTL